jgi:hypothetical protein
LRSLLQVKLLLLLLLLLLPLLLKRLCSQFPFSGIYSLSVSIGTFPLSIPSALLNIVVLPAVWSAR